MNERVDQTPATLACAAQGDCAAFGDVVREHQGMVFSFAYNFLQNAGVAEELAQEVFLELHSAIRSIRSEAHLVYWLRKVTMHRCIDHVRRERRRRGPTLDEIAEPSTSDPDTDPLLSARLQKLVSALPESLRAVVVLRYQEDLEPAEIASTLSMPVNTVKSYLQRGLGLLREKLKRVHGEAGL